MGETMSRAVIEALKAELAQHKAALSEANTALSLVSGALADANCVVGPAVEFGDQVRKLAIERAFAKQEVSQMRAELALMRELAKSQREAAESAQDRRDAAVTLLREAREYRYGLASEFRDRIDAFLSPREGAKEQAARKRCPQGDPRCGCQDDADPAPAAGEEKESKEAHNGEDRGGASQQRTDSGAGDAGNIQDDGRGPGGEGRQVLHRDEQPRVHPVRSGAAGVCEETDRIEPAPAASEGVKDPAQALGEWLWDKGHDHEMDLFRAALAAAERKGLERAAKWCVENGFRGVAIRIRALAAEQPATEKKP